MQAEVIEMGMLWFDNNPQSDFLSKVKKAAAYYQKKYGQTPNLCFVHPSMMPDKVLMAGKVTVCVNNSMLLHHFWIGVQQQNSPVP